MNTENQNNLISTGIQVSSNAFPYKERSVKQTNIIIVADTFEVVGGEAWFFKLDAKLSGTFTLGAKASFGIDSVRIPATISNENNVITVVAKQFPVLNAGTHTFTLKHEIFGEFFTTEVISILFTNNPGSGTFIPVYGLPVNTALTTFKN